MQSYGAPMMEVERRTREFQKEIRQKDLALRFESARKKMRNSHRVSEGRQEKEFKISIVYGMMKEVQRDMEGAVHKLWDYCLMNSFQYFSVSHIETLTQKLRKWQTEGQEGEYNLSMGITLLVNWASAPKQLNYQYKQLIKFLVCLLVQRQGTSLKSYILYLLANVCQDTQSAIFLMNLEIIHELTKIYQSMKGHENVVSFLLKKLLIALPSNYEFKQNTITLLIIFLKDMVAKSKDFVQLKQNSVFLINQLMLLNKGKFIEVVLGELIQEILQMVLLLEKKMRFQVWSSIYNILAIVYRQTFREDSKFWQEGFVQRLWLITQSLLLYPVNKSLREEDNSFEVFRSQLWVFMDIFLKLQLPSKQARLIWLRDQCLYKQTYDWEEHALTILTKALPNEEVMKLIQKKFKLFISLNEPTISMLTVLLNTLQSDSRRDIDFNQMSEIFEDVRTIIYDQREEIAELASKINYIVEKYLCPEKHIKQACNLIFSEQNTEKKGTFDYQKQYCLNSQE